MAQASCVASAKEGPRWVVEGICQRASRPCDATSATNARKHFMSGAVLHCIASAPRWCRCSGHLRGGGGGGGAGQGGVQQDGDPQGSTPFGQHLRRIPRASRIYCLYLRLLRLLSVVTVVCGSVRSILYPGGLRARSAQRKETATFAGRTPTCV